MSSPRPLPPPPAPSTQRDREAGPGASEGSRLSSDSPRTGGLSLRVRSPRSWRVGAGVAAREDSHCPPPGWAPRSREGAPRERVGQARARSEQEALSRGRGGAGRALRGGGRGGGGGRWEGRGRAAAAPPHAPRLAHSPRPLARSPASPRAALAPPSSPGLGGSRAPGEAQAPSARTGARQTASGSLGPRLQGGLCGLPRQGRPAGSARPGPRPRRPAGTMNRKARRCLGHLFLSLGMVYLRIG